MRPISTRYRVRVVEANLNETERDGSAVTAHVGRYLPATDQLADTKERTHLRGDNK